MFNILLFWVLPSLITLLVCVHGLVKHPSEANSIHWIMSILFSILYPLFWLVFTLFYIPKIWPILIKHREINIKQWFKNR